jgi:hypothetical protein
VFFYLPRQGESDRFCSAQIVKLVDGLLTVVMLRMGTELVPETLYSNELTRLCAREDYIESCRRESFKTCTFIIRNLQQIHELRTDTFFASRVISVYIYKYLRKKYHYYYNTKK